MNERARALIEKRVRSYFASCNRGVALEVAEHFTVDARVYDINHPPVCGKNAIGEFWARTAKRWGGAVWTVDCIISEGSDMAIEWSMEGIHIDRRFIIHGSEHYRFKGGLIDEIRQYWLFDPQYPGSGLVNYPYRES